MQFFPILEHHARLKELAAVVNPIEYKNLKRKIEQITYLEVKNGKSLSEMIEFWKDDDLENLHNDEDDDSFSQRNVELEYDDYYDGKLIEEIMTRRPSPELADIVGIKEITIFECESKIKDYVVKHDLFLDDTMFSQRFRYFSPDKKLAKIFGNTDSIDICGSEFTDFISSHLLEIILENDSKIWSELTTPKKLLSKELAKDIGIQEASHVECIRKIRAYMDRANLFRDTVRNLVRYYGLPNL